jgi:hypothetical protein
VRLKDYFSDNTTNKKRRVETPGTIQAPVAQPQREGAVPPQPSESQASIAAAPARSLPPQTPAPQPQAEYFSFVKEEQRESQADHQYLNLLVGPRARPLPSEPWEPRSCSNSSASRYSAKYVLKSLIINDAVEESGAEQAARQRGDGLDSRDPDSPEKPEREAPAEPESPGDDRAWERALWVLNTPLLSELRVKGSRG